MIRLRSVTRKCLLSLRKGGRNDYRRHLVKVASRNGLRSGKEQREISAKEGRERENQRGREGERIREGERELTITRVERTRFCFSSLFIVLITSSLFDGVNHCLFFLFLILLIIVFTISHILVS